RRVISVILRGYVNATRVETLCALPGEKPQFLQAGLSGEDACHVIAWAGVHEQRPFPGRDQLGSDFAREARRLDAAELGFAERSRHERRHGLYVALADFGGRQRKVAKEARLSNCK